MPKTWRTELSVTRWAAAAIGVRQHDLRQVRRAVSDASPCDRRRAENAPAMVQGAWQAWRSR